MASLAFVKKNPSFSTLLVLEFLLFILVSYQVEIEPKISLLEKIGLTIFGPVQSLNDSISDKVSSNAATRKTMTELRDENQRLLDRVKDNQQLVVQVKELTQENDRLRHLLNLRKVPKWNYVVAEVVGRSRRHSDFMITINKGTDHGVVADRGVFCVQGVVGIVWEASDSYAKIMTLNNPGSVVAAIVQNSRYQESFVSGAGGSMGKLENVPNFEPVKKGDLILTSGLDQIFPKGLRIGRVTAAKPTSLAFQEIDIQLGTEFSRLEEVIVLVPVEAAEATDEME